MKQRKLSTRQIIIGGLLVALAVVMSYQNIYLYPPNSGRITLRFIPILYGSVLLGPFIGALIGGLQDILTYFLTSGSQGMFFPGFTITAIIMGIFPAYIIKYTGKKIILRVVYITIISFVITIVLDSVWLAILTKKGYLFFISIRILPNIIQSIITGVALYFMFTRIKVSDNNLK